MTFADKLLKVLRFRDKLERRIYIQLMSSCMICSVGILEVTNTQYFLGMMLIVCSGILLYFVCYDILFTPPTISQDGKLEDKK